MVLVTFGRCGRGGIRLTMSWHQRAGCDRDLSERHLGSPSPAGEGGASQAGGSDSNHALSETAGMRFTGDVWAVPEATVVFENEPILELRHHR